MRIRRILIGAAILLGIVLFGSTYFWPAYGVWARILLLGFWTAVQVAVWIRQKSWASVDDELRMELSMAVPFTWMCSEGSRNLPPPWDWIFLLLAGITALLVVWRLFRFLRRSKL